MISARMVMVVPVVDGSLLQATRETCSRVQLQQLLQHDLYPEDNAAALAAQARGVLIFVKTVSRAKAAVKCRDDQARARVLIFVKTVSRAKAALQTTPFISRVAAFALRWSGWVRRAVTRRIVYLLLLLLACVALFKFRRGGSLLVIQMLLRYRRH